MKLFEKIRMASEDVQSYLVTGRCENELGDGDIVTIGELCDHEVYAGMKDMNAHKIEAGYTAGKPFGIVDYVGVSEPMVQGVRYRVGDKIVGLPVPANTATRVRIIMPMDKFFLGDENFDAVPTAGDVCVPSADGKYAKGAEGNGFCFRVEYATNKIMGQTNAGKKYYCTVLSV